MNEWVVIVDDEVLSLTNARTLLTEENMRVSCMKSGRELLRYMEKNTPDLILLDILMPEMDGFETYHALRELEEKTGRNKTPVIFLTGEIDASIEQRSLKIGASDFIKKPFDKDVLVSRIRNTVKNSKTIESLTEEASLDKLTGFLNKASGTSRVAKCCKNETGALMILDLDSFKLVNDLFGHDMGDRVLMAFADVIRANTGEEDVPARIGGDEFMMFRAGAKGSEELETLTQKINDDLLEAAARLMGADHGIPLGVSVGAVTIPEHGRDYESLFSLADNALYHVKQNGKHGCAVYHRGDDDEVFDGTDLDREIIRITRIVEERNDGEGALLLGRESFATVYRFIIRFNKMYGGSAVKALFSLSPEYERLPHGNLSEIYAQFGLTLQKTLRKSDIIMQNRSNQFFVFLPELTEEDMPKILNRIMENWNASSYSRGIRVEHALQFILPE